jgi:glycosyltransferase involved in cell wall biosynthesis
MNTRPIVIGAFFPKSLETEGVGTLVFGLTQGLVRNGHRIEMVLPRGNYELPSEVSVTTYRTGLGALRSYRQAIRNRSTDARAVFLFEISPSMGFLASASRCANTYLYFYTPVLTLSTSREIGRNLQRWKHVVVMHSIWNRLQKWSQRRCIVATEFQANQLRKYSCQQLHILPASPISAERSVPTRSQAREQLDFPKDEFIAGYLGHFSPAKGVDTLIEAFDLYHLPGKLALAHSRGGKLPATSIVLLERLRRANRILEYEIVDPLVFLAACDVVILPYRTSSIHHLPLVLIESYAAATAVITTNVGGLSSIHHDGRLGRTCNPRDADGLALLLGEAVADKQRWWNMGKTCRIVFEETLSRETLVEAFEKLITAECQQ